MSCESVKEVKILVQFEILLRTFTRLSNFILRKSTTKVRMTCPPYFFRMSKLFDSNWLGRDEEGRIRHKMQYKAFLPPGSVPRGPLPHSQSLAESNSHARGVFLTISHLASDTFKTT